MIKFETNLYKGSSDDVVDIVHLDKYVVLKHAQRNNTIVVLDVVEAA